MSDEYTDVPYVGTVKGLIEKTNDWYTVEIAVPGKQYPIKADTKLDNLLKSVREIRDAGLVATFIVRESASQNINPNTGNPYTERRLQSVEAGAQNQQNATASPSGGQQGSGASDGGGMTKEEWRAKDRAADKRALTAIAVSALTHTMPADPSTEDLNKFLERVGHLTLAWQNVIEAVRDGDDIPF